MLDSETDIMRTLLIKPSRVFGGADNVGGRTQALITTQLPSSLNSSLNARRNFGKINQLLPK